MDSDKKNSKPELQGLGGRKGRVRKPRVSSIQPLAVQDEQVIESMDGTIDVHLPPPETPVPDLFSPTPEPSVGRTEGRDTPPPSNAARDANLEGPGRPSRRARAAVSYAEPSLNTKMRRPGQKVDAVYIVKSQFGDKSSSSQDEKTTMRTVVIKREEDGDAAWKSLPSVSNTNSTNGDMPLQQQQQPSEASSKTSSSGAAIKALMQGAGPKHNQTNGKPQKDDASVIPTTGNEKTSTLSAKMQDLDIYDFKDSSPTTDRVDTGKTAKSLTTATKHRRHSSVPGTAGATAAVGASRRELGAAGRRIELDLASSSPLSDKDCAGVSAGADEKPTKFGTVDARKTQSQSQSQSQTQVNGTTSSRSERAASTRRRSMMV